MGGGVGTKPDTDRPAARRRRWQRRGQAGISALSHGFRDVRVGGSWEVGVRQGAPGTYWRPDPGRLRLPSCTPTTRPALACGMVGRAAMVLGACVR